MNHYETVFKTETEFRNLKDIILNLLGVDVFNNKRRYREIVNAKMIYSVLLTNQGYGCSIISKSIGMNHATVLHYCKNFPSYIKGDVNLKRSYEKCEADFYTEYDPIYLLNEQELKSEIFALRNEKKELHLQIERLTLEQTQSKRADERLRGIMDMVRQRTPKDREKETQIKLNIFYNGL